MCNVGTKFETILNELCDLIEKDPNWKNYVEEKSIKFLEEFYQTRDLKALINKGEISYGNFKAKVIVAVDRIKNKKTSRIRNGKSDKAKKLLELLSIDQWQAPLTEREILYASLFKKHKNFYEVGRVLDVNPSNVAGALYGTNQRKGVITKLEQFKKQNLSKNA